MKPLRISYSAARDWQTCQELYSKRHIEQLQPKLRQAAPELGTMIHEYFRLYYSRLDPGDDHTPREHHRYALTVTMRKFKPEILSLASLADGLGAEEEAKKLLSLPLTARRLLNAYFRVQGKADATQHEIIAVEHRFELPVDGKHVVLPGVIDLVTRTQDGNVWLWEHKTTGSIPSQGRRFRDLQVLIYKVAVEEILGLEPTGVIWNYIRTKPPVPPKVLKNGLLSTAQHQTTTLGLFKKAMRGAGADPHKYDSYLRQLERHEREVMFPRHTLALTQSEEVLLRDYVATVHEIEAARSKKDFIPIRNLGAQCDWCPFVKLCQAAVAGGDIDGLRQRHFKADKKKR
jgi:hypothetical protein